MNEVHQEKDLPENNNNNTNILSIHKYNVYYKHTSPIHTMKFQIPTTILVIRILDVVLFM